MSAGRLKGVEEALHRALEYVQLENRRYDSESEHTKVVVRVKDVCVLEQVFDDRRDFLIIFSREEAERVARELLEAAKLLPTRSG